MAFETLEDKKQEEIANVEDKGEVKEEGKTEEGEEEKEVEKKEENTEMAEKEEEEEEKEEPEVKGEESKEEAEEVSKKAKRGRKGSSKKAAKDEKAAKSEPGSKEPVTPIERLIRERKTVERVKAHSLMIYQMVCIYHLSSSEFVNSDVEKTLKNQLEGSNDAAGRAASLPVLLCHGLGIFTYMYAVFNIYIPNFVSRWLDGHHVVFGKVLSGMDVVSKIEAEGRQSGDPRSEVVVSDSGELHS
ncbi:myb-like protein X [Camellia sinensis]|uniref:myb-like protein X n=1 Tax=Camellia sinensis TaxID=4442 RepID=UPI001035B9FD|nr:myb-like protein X [Camellia sinensis]